jgi:hypothetical protein
VHLFLKVHVVGLLAVLACFANGKALGKRMEPVLLAEELKDTDTFAIPSPFADVISILQPVSFAAKRTF